MRMNRQILKEAVIFCRFMGKGLHDESASAKLRIGNIGMLLIVVNLREVYG